VVHCHLALRLENPTSYVELDLASLLHGVQGVAGGVHDVVVDLLGLIEVSDNEFHHTRG
jgi:hypothetical protein